MTCGGHRGILRAVWAGESPRLAEKPFFREDFEDARQHRLRCRILRVALRPFVSRFAEQMGGGFPATLEAGAGVAAQVGTNLRHVAGLSRNYASGRQSVNGGGAEQARFVTQEPILMDSRAKLD